MTAEVTESSTDAQSSSVVTDGDPPTATLHLRTGPTGPAADRQQATVEEFEAVRKDRSLPDATVKRWGRTVATSGDTNEAAAAIDTYRDFREAVTAAGGRLEPFFERRTRTPGLLLESRPEEVVVFPVACLALRREGTVTGLYPCWLDGEHHSLEVGLAALAEGTAENLA